MPNWCNNEIQVTGDEGELQRFREFVRDTKAYHGSCTDMFKWVFNSCLLYTSPSPRDGLLSRMPSSA